MGIRCATQVAVSGAIGRDIDTGEALRLSQGDKTKHIKISAVLELKPQAKAVDVHFNALGFFLGIRRRRLHHGFSSKR